MYTLQPAQTTPSVALQPAPAEPHNHQGNFLMTKEEIQELISSQLKQTIDEAAPKRKSRGHLYPIEYDSIPFPDGYIVPKFKTFYSIGVAFEWYYSLDDESITTWDEMEEAFRTKFATISDKITIADMVAIRRRKDESMPEYITRWRNLSIRCEQPIEQTQAVGLLMDPPTENTNFVNIKDENNEEEDTPPPEFWNIFLSKKTHKMLKYLNTVPGITWRSPLHPEVQTSSSEIAQSSYFRKAKNNLKGEGTKIRETSSA
uniref:Retrotransposon gag domain-containing protein n=1 Tax=Ananas comosus var. bracteatus TaxID=296719 RepID=A0A6V7QCI8_ANACO|nr:unnamed protein product [Ananas comosus var. bracteatus]